METYIVLSELIHLLPKELWNIIGIYYRKALFDDILCYLNRCNRRKISLSQSGKALILRTCRKNIKNRIISGFGDIYMFTQRKEGPLWCFEHHKKMEGRVLCASCGTYEGCDKDRCRAYKRIIITNYNIVFVDILLINKL